VKTVSTIRLKMPSEETAGCVELNGLKARLGIYVPIYKGWVRGVDEGENDPTFQYAA
jgi:FMNH2-dependent dimethyl sulfone monooxygenase